jgi:hypothetical protein
MALNDVYRSPSYGAGGVPVATKAIVATSETPFELDGANSNGVPLVPCKSINIGTRAGADLKVALRAGDIAAGKFYTAVGGSKIQLNQIRQTTIYVAVSVNDTVEAMPA